MLKNKKKINFNEVSTWLFDLDNTLYPFDNNVFVQVSDRIVKFISQEFELSESNAEKERRRLYNLYGTSLCGLMKERKIDPADFLEFVHDIDLSFLERDPSLDKALQSIKSKKVIYTNGSYKHAENVLSKLGIINNFFSIHSIETAKYIPKPNLETYEKLIKIENVDPQSTVMVEDTAWNLKPAYELGMKTVLVYPKNKTFDLKKNRYIDYITTNLVEFLSDQD